jgi:hypothetical protein
MVCDVCSAFNDITPDNKYIRSLILHTKLVHRQAQSKSSECESCKKIEEIIEDRQSLGKISSSTLDIIREHLKALHRLV